jgi:hypothetical protein
MAVQKRDGHISAGVRYNADTIDDLFAYAEANRQLASQLAAGGGEVEIYITFRTYVEPEQFRSWARTIGLKATWSAIRIVTDVNAVIGVEGYENDPLPQVVYEEQLRPFSEEAQREPQRAIREIKGIYYTFGSVPADKLIQIANDPLVFIADVTPNIVRQELIKAGIPGAEQASVGIGTTFDASVTTPFWDMEGKFGLDKFQK